MSILMHMQELGKQIHETAKEHGFWAHAGLPADGDPLDADNQSIVQEKLALIHSEVSEVLEVWRLKNRIESRDEFDGALGDEFADIIIRTLDLCEYLGLPIDVFVDRKMRVNVERPHMHGKAC